MAKKKAKTVSNTPQIIILNDKDIKTEYYEDVIRKSRYLARNYFPYYTHSLMAITFKFTYASMDYGGNPTFSIDKHLRCYINPLIVDAWIKQAQEVTEKAPCPTCGKTYHNKFAYVSGVILHEMGHPMQKHFFRAKKYHGPEFRADICNAALDCELNDSLLESIKFCDTENICLPPNGCYPKNFDMPDHLFWEEYYELLLKKFPPGQSGKGKGSKGQIPEGGRCGSGADGMERDFEDPGEGDSDSFEGVSEAELDTINRKVAQDMKEHAEKKPGSVPSNMLRWANELISPPKYDWRSELNRMIRYCSSRYTTGHKITTYSKRSIISTVLNDKVILPTYKKPLPNVAQVFDTSGSMDNNMIKAAIAEGEGVCKLLKAKVTVIDVDTEARVSKTKSLKTAKLAGGGGTDMRVGIQAALDQRDKPNLILVFTDGYTPWPESQPRGVQVIVCLCGDKSQVTSDNIPRWMKVINVEPDAA